MHNLPCRLPDTVATRRAQFIIQIARHCSNTPYIICHTDGQTLWQQAVHNLPYRLQDTVVTRRAQFQKPPVQDCLAVEDDTEMFSRHVGTTDLRCIISQNNEDLVL